MIDGGHPSRKGYRELIHTARGWVELKRMLVADLREASRALPRGTRADTVALADRIYLKNRIGSDGG